MARMFSATVHAGAIADKQLASLPDDARVMVVAAEDDHGELDADTEDELEARIAEADRGDSFVDASEVLRRLDSRRSRRDSACILDRRAVPRATPVACSPRRSVHWTRRRWVEGRRPDERERCCIVTSTNPARSQRHSIASEDGHRSLGPRSLAHRRGQTSGDRALA
jgi:hypothetical protein